jgi:hypothetical protein
MKIFKYELKIQDEQGLSLSKHSTILSVKEQNDKIVLYAIVNENYQGEKDKYIIHIRGTGHPLDFRVHSSVFLGTIKLLEGKIMFHVFTEFCNREE